MSDNNEQQDPTTDDVTIPTGEDQPQDPDTEPTDEGLEAGDETDPEGGQAPGDEPEPLTKELPDAETRRRESEREAQVLIGRSTQLKGQIEKLTSNKPPTEAELRTEYPNWDVMDDVQRDLARNQLTLSRNINDLRLKEIRREEQAMWQKDFDNAMAANPSLKGREQDFKEYCYKPTHRNVPVSVLASAFLHDNPSQEAPSTTPPKPRSSAIQRGSGGPKQTTTVNKKFTPDQAAEMRLKEPQKYQKLLKAGLLDIQE